MLNLTITDPLDAYEKIAVGIKTFKTRMTADALTTCPIDVYYDIEVVRSAVYPILTAS